MVQTKDMYYNRKIQELKLKVYEMKNLKRKWSKNKSLKQNISSPM